MTRAHRSVGADDGEHRIWPAVGAARATRRPTAMEAGDLAPDERAVAAPGTADARSLRVSELESAAEALRQDPSALLEEPQRAMARDNLELAAKLPEEVAALAVGLARLDPSVAAVVAGMIERYATAERRRRRPAS
jgi:hypothetical protein